ncbi:MAG TPA: HK97-gp10 family putative phage morphogenesis protein [Pirellulales bacterium]|nr:HK97-gp10 family putative phage morphogenesis protein [Pirellulales bacterium]
MAKIIVTGVRELDAALKRLGDPKLINKLAKQQMRAAMKPILAEARATAPVGESGDLQRSIKLRAGKAQRSRVTMQVAIGDRNFYGEKWYAAFVAFGTERIRPHEWMRETYLGQRQAAKESVINGLWRAIEQEAEKR